MRQHIGVSLSGGGHRATIWALGVLLYLVDAGKSGEVAALSSVSGGSIANGVVAQKVDYGTTDPDRFDAAIRRLVRHVADEGLVFWGRATNPYVLSVFGLAGLGVVTLLAGLVLVALRGMDALSGPTIAAAVVVLLLTAWLFERRSAVVDRALASTHFNRDGLPTRLAEVDRSIDHVFCATELQSGGHLYMAPRFIYSYALGMGDPADLLLSTAVQASACLPGAFAFRRLPTAPHGFRGGSQPAADEMLLTDGGVYDNMGDQWFDGLARRLMRSPSLPAHGRHIDEIIVVNSSAPVEWRLLRRSRLALAAEIATLRRVNDVMYQVTTQRRRYDLIGRWDQADRDGLGVHGVLVHIAQSPYRMADFYRDAPDWPDRAERARSVIRLLHDGPDERSHWAARTAASRAVPTVLRRLGQEATVNLLEHAYVLAMSNSHVLLDYPLLALPPRERFTALLADPAQGSTIPTSFGR
jgi:hypothetical protein